MDEVDVDKATKAMADQLSEMFPEEEKIRWRNRLRTERTKRNLTLEVVSKAVGLTLGYLSQIERGINVPSLPRALRFAHFYGVSIEYLWPPVNQAETNGDTSAET